MAKILNGVNRFPFILYIFSLIRSQQCHSVGIIYETNVRQKIGPTVFSTQNLELINMDMSGGYAQIS